MAKLTELVAANTTASATVGAFEATASGALANGDIVSLNSDGTVSVTSGLGLDETRIATTFSYNHDGVYDPNSNKVVITYIGDSNYANAVVGTVSGTTITFGTPVVFRSATVGYLSSTFDTVNNKVIAAWSDQGNNGAAAVGTVSGNSISFGSLSNFEGNTVNWVSCCYDESAQRVLIAYKDVNDNGYGTAVVGTVSGTSISLGSPYVFVYGQTEVIKSVYDPDTQQVVLSYINPSNGYLYSSVGVVSSTSSSWGSSVSVQNDLIEQHSIVYDTTNNKIVIAFQNETNQRRGQAKVGTVSNTSISFGSEVTFDGDASINVFMDTTGKSMIFDPVSGKVFIIYNRSSGSGAAYIVDGTVSGTSITFGTPVALGFGLDSRTLVHDPDENVVVLGYRSNTNNYPAGAVYNPSSNIGSWIGFSGDTTADNGTAKINNLGGVNSGQTGLTPGATYYLQNDGTISTTEIADREVGRAISETSIMVTKPSATL